MRRDETLREVQLSDSESPNDDAAFARDHSTAPRMAMVNSSDSDRHHLDDHYLLSARLWRIISTRLIVICRRSRPHLVRVTSFSMLANA
jgi:hypothetical protein